MTTNVAPALNLKADEDVVKNQPADLKKEVADLAVTVNERGVMSVATLWSKALQLDERFEVSPTAICDMTWDSLVAQFPGHATLADRSPAYRWLRGRRHKK